MRLGRWLWSGVMLSAGCFSGADADGLPCVEDDACGRGVSCVEGFCGGPPPTTGSTTVPGTGSSGVAESSSGEASSGSTGPSALCGDGVVNDGESCDDAGESATCNADCTDAVCGDGVTNATAGEACDVPGGDPFYAECTEFCQEALFWDDLSDDDKWEIGLPAIGGTQLLDPHVWGLDNNVWRTGEYSCDSGAADLTFDADIALDAPMGMKPELRFRHLHLFDTCGKTGEGPDGGAVYVLVGGEELPLMFNDTIADTGGCAEANPLEMISGFDRQNDEFEEESASLESWDTQSIKIRFRVGYDCANCGYRCSGGLEDPPAGYGWQINRVGVAYVPI